MGNAERLQVRNDRRGLLEAEILRELQPIRGGGSDRHHASPIAQKTDHGGKRSGAWPPQIARPGIAAGPRVVVWTETFATSASRLSSPSRHCAVRMLAC